MYRMKRILTILFVQSLLLTLAAQSLLPYPQKVEWGKGRVKTNQIVREQVTNPAAPSLQAPKGWYRLDITADGVRLQYRDEEGLRYGNATLSQLRKGDAYPLCQIEDWPSYEWRGAMLDLSRHYFPVEELRRHVDILSAYKINRLHLHLVDAAGWRLEIKRYPRLTAKTAYRTQEGWNEWWIGRDRKYVDTDEALAHPESRAYGGYYTQQEMRDLVAYAASRGITIVPEIEMPGHSEEVMYAYPELSCSHRFGAADFCPGNVGTYEFLENVLREVMDIFPSEYIHVGGDEAGRADWPTCPCCQQKLKEIGGTDFRDLQTYLIAYMGRFLEANHRKLVGWDEVIDPGLHPGSTVMVWRGVEKAAEAARLGLDVVMTPGAYCYFDSYQDAPPTQPEGFGTYLPLDKVYSFDPLKGLTEEQCHHIKGVQGNLWAEYVPNSSHQEYMLYPRILALAEIGWGTGGRSDFRSRALAATDQLRAQGVNAFNLRTEVGERKSVNTPIRHKAVGAKVTYHSRYADNYNGNGDGTLTDGRGGGWAFGDGRWQGFIRRGESGYVFDVTLDLGKSQAVSQVTTCFMQACGAEIYYPVDYRVSTSADGTNWTSFSAKEHPFLRTPNPEVDDFTVNGKARARYIRVQANNGQDGGWIFADEIVVK